MDSRISARIQVTRQIVRVVEPNELALKSGSNRVRSDAIRFTGV